MKKNQKGAALIVVLFFLVILTIIGTLAVRQSLVGLNIATNSQAQQLQLQNSEASFFKAEDVDRLEEAFSGEGFLAYFNNVLGLDKELVFCFRGDQKPFFDINKASAVEWEQGKTSPTNSNLGKDGFCDASEQSTNFFTSGRKVAMTQVAIKYSTVNNTARLSGLVTGTDPKSMQADAAKPVKLFVVTLMPTLSSENRSAINECLQNHMSEVTIPLGTAVPQSSKYRKSVTECLKDLSVPFSSYTTEYSSVEAAT